MYSRNKRNKKLQIFALALFLALILTVSSLNKNLFGDNKLLLYVFGFSLLAMAAIRVINSKRTLKGEIIAHEMQKEGFIPLWVNTLKFDNEPMENMNSNIYQKKSYEILWKKTVALNDELIRKNQMLVSLNAKISDQQKKLLMLNSIGEYMVSSSNIREVLTSIISLARNILDFNTARILEYNPQKNALELVLSVGYPLEKGLMEIPINEGIVGYAARNKEIVYVSDVSKDDRYILELAETKSEVAIPFLVKDELIGVLDFQNDKHFIFQEDEEQFLLLKVLGNHTAMVLKNYQLTEDVRQRFLDIVEALVRVMEAKDLYTSGHCERVKEMAVEIGYRMNLSQGELETLELAALLHDIGKIGMPENILNNKGKLTKEQYDIIKKHPLIGYQMLEDIVPLQRINKIILQHHERIDGKGYPNGLTGEGIDPLAKIITVADAVDAMTSVRPYRPIQSLNYVLNQLEIHSGTQFDERVAAIAKEILLDKKNVI